MSNLYSSVSNYSGRQPDNQQGIKQFVTTIKNQAIWVYKRLSTGQILITPGDSKRDFLIPNDLIVEGSINNPSDIILKTNIQEIKEETNTNLLNLVPIEFIYKSDTDKKKHYGLIAQKVEEIYPELVSNKSGYKSVNYIELIPILLSKMKNMQDEINELKKRTSNDL
jgi:hypothetical protein